VSAHTFRANNLHTLGRFEEADRDYQAAALKQPDDLRLLFGRARFELYRGRYGDARRYLDRWLILFGSGRRDAGSNQLPYVVLWQHLTNAQMQRSDRKELTRSAALVDHTKWPSPIIDYLLGKLDEQQLQSAANTGTEDAKRQQSCEVNAYVGAERFAHSRDDGARQLLEKAVALCSPDLIEKELAAYELGHP